MKGAMILAEEEAARSVGSGFSYAYKKAFNEFYSFYLKKDATKRIYI
jgi:hypothetical protein